MKKIWLIILSLFSLIGFAFIIPFNPVAAHADTGPKPDIQINIENLEKSDYIIGFGQKLTNYGPHCAYEPGEEAYDGDIEDLNLLYSNVDLPDGWYLSDISRFYSNTSNIEIHSGYMWPKDFILIILNKLNTKYYLSEETSTYAFHSYFTYDMDNYDEGSLILNKPIVLEANYKYGKEILEFFLRLTVTLGIELLLALLFKFTKKSFLIIALTNLTTQIGLNVALNLTAHFHGKNPYLAIIYFFIELLIILIEAIVFAIFCKRKDKQSKFITILYAISANVLSFGLGMLLWFII